MHPEGTWSGTSRALAIWLLAVVVPPAVMLVWFGAQMLQQDRSLLAEREQERRAAAVATGVHDLESSLAGAERSLLDGGVPEGCVRLVLSDTGIQAEPACRVAWVPAPPTLPAVEASAFRDAEALEFRGDWRRALVSYQRMSNSGEIGLRAGALLRSARIFRQQRRWQEALATYRVLADTSQVAIAGAPSDLQARRAACSVMAEAGQHAALAAAARDLEADFLAGRWTIDREAWELTAADLARWTGHAVQVSSDRRLFSAVASRLWEERQRGAWPDSRPAGRRLVETAETAVTAVWRTQGARATVLAIAPAVLQAWARHAAAGGAQVSVRLNVAGPSGELLAGNASASDATPTKAQASDTGLPWTVVVAAGDSLSLSRDLALRRRLLSLGLVAILLFLGGASFFLWRVVHREMAVVRQQKDFVSAVSHEFRTPLTSLRHVTELLQESDDLPPARRHAFYDALARSTDRLHRLVESLLDFSRMERGKKPYDLQPADVADLVERVVAEFRREVALRDINIDLDVRNHLDRPFRVRADATALTRAIWNLLDNAVKYSPGADAVLVSVAHEPTGIAITVRDKGLGIPLHEQKEIFRRFVRGERARHLGIKGTGLGLAIVSHIVSAHGGTIELESKAGAGSTFRVVLPALD